MAKRLETPWAPRMDVVCDEFRSDASYANWRPNGSGDWLMIYTVSGAGYLTSKSGEGATRTGEVTLYAPGDLHDYKTDPATGQWRLLWVHFVAKPTWGPWLRWPLGSHGVRSLQLGKGGVQEPFVAAMQRMIRIFQRRPPNVRDFTYNALEEVLLWAQVAASRDPWMSMDDRVRKAMDYLTAERREPFRMERVARHCGISASRLAHLFKAVTGMSAQTFFERQRMEHAGRLLQLTGLSVGEVAVEVGYDDPFYFSNRFRKYAGRSPSGFRGEGLGGERKKRRRAG